MLWEADIMCQKEKETEENKIVFVSLANNVISKPNYKHNKIILTNLNEEGSMPRK